MNYWRLLFYLFIANQSVIFAQTDSLKKKFKPYGLIDAAPVAINKDDFKPQVILTIHAQDALTKLPINVKFDYYTLGDSVITTENGEVVSLTANLNKKTVIISNAPGYIWQTQIVENLDTDTSYFLKFERIKKGELITKHFINSNLLENKWEFYFYPDLIGIKDFLRLNPSVKIKIYTSAILKEIIESYFGKNYNKKRIIFKSSQNKKQENPETFTIKILRT